MFLLFSVFTWWNLWIQSQTLLVRRFGVRVVVQLPARQRVQEVTSPPEASISFSSSASLSTLTVNSDTDVVFLVSRHLRSRSNRRRTADTRNKPKMCEAGRLHAESKRVLLWGCKVLPCHYYTQSVRVRGSLSGAGEMTSWSVDKYTAGIKK